MQNGEERPALEWHGSLNPEEPDYRHWAKPSAIMVLLTPADRPSVLLIERPHTLSHHGGQIGCPGGAVDVRTDRTLWDTARRETREEVGIEVPPAALLGWLDPVYIPPSGFTVAPAVALLPDWPRVSPAPQEVSAYHWVPLGQLRQVRRYAQRLVSQRTYQMAEFPLEWGLVWGATARVLDQLLEKIR
ncbi:MAG: CoA pyrophosphatase [Firmicutes bacterium]|nr:CoA pyrophosphatase [Bacillota bacterium]